MYVYNTFVTQSHIRNKKERKERQPETKQKTSP